MSDKKYCKNCKYILEHEMTEAAYIEQEGYSCTSGIFEDMDCIGNKIKHRAVCNFKNSGLNCSEYEEKEAPEDIVAVGSFMKLVNKFIYGTSEGKEQLKKGSK